MEPGFDYKIVTKKGKISSTRNPYAMALKKEVKDQYMMGEYLLVAPMFKGQKSRKIILPQGKWYDFYTGKFVGDGKVITAKHGLDNIATLLWYYSTAKPDGKLVSIMNRTFY